MHFWPNAGRRWGKEHPPGGWIWRWTRRRGNGLAAKGAEQDLPSGRRWPRTVEVQPQRGRAGIQGCNKSSEGGDSGDQPGPSPFFAGGPLRSTCASKQGFREVGSKVESWPLFEVRSALEGPRMTHLSVDKAWPTEKPPRTYDTSPGA